MWRSYETPHLYPLYKKPYNRKPNAQEDLIILDDELLIHRRAYLRIWDWRNPTKTLTKINKIKGNSNHNHRGAPHPCAKAAPMIDVSFDLIDFFACFPRISPISVSIDMPQSGDEWERPNPVMSERGELEIGCNPSWNPTPYHRLPSGM